VATTRRIPREQLEAYFDAFSKKFLPEESRDSADVEVIAPDWGAQYVAEGVHLSGISYDPHDNALDFVLETGDHRVYQPAEVWTIEEPDGFVNTIDIVQQDGVRQVVTVRKVGLRPVR
jgi:uncharacterized protein DUF5335